MWKWVLGFAVIGVVLWAFRKWLREHWLLVVGPTLLLVLYCGLRNQTDWLLWTGLHPLKYGDHGTVGDAFAPITALLAFAAFYLTFSGAKEEKEHRGKLLQAQELLANNFTHAAVIMAKVSDAQARRDVARVAEEAFHRTEEFRLATVRTLCSAQPGGEIESYPEPPRVPIGLPEELFEPIDAFYNAVLEFNQIAMDLADEVLYARRERVTVSEAVNLGHAALQMGKPVVAAVRSYLFGGEPAPLPSLLDMGKVN